MDAAETLAVLLAEAHDRFVENVEGVSLEEALDPAGGHRRSLRGAADVDAPHPVHWGDRMRLADIVVAVSQHWVYHAGEINAILAIHRGEAWEYTEEVEENHILVPDPVASPS